MENILNKQVAEIVAADYRTAEVFKKYEIDFCCNGDVLLSKVCIEQNIDPQKLEKELGGIQARPDSGNPAYQTWPLGLLVEYIERIHHHYVNSRISSIQENLDKIAEVHGTEHPELLKIKSIFHQAAGELTMHMKKEELILFPFIKKMEKALERGENLNSPSFQSVENPVAAMKEEHEDEGEYFRQIRALSQGYTPPADACNTYKLSYSLLEEFENDLHKHIHLENNILFPRAIELEQKLEAAA